jgi:hypothetical protein
MAGPIITGLIFSTIVIILSMYKPNICRVFLGIFFIAMGLGVNVSYLITQPFFVYEYGMGAWMPLFRNLTESIIGINPKLFGILLIVFETLTGLLLMGKGIWVKLGIFTASLFILMLIPLYYSQIAWAVSVFGILYLLRLDYTLDVFGKITDFIEKKKSK